MALHLTAVAAKDSAGTAIPGGVDQHDTSGTGAGPNVPAVVLVDSASAEILGTKADAAATQTDTTAISFMSAIKQISKSLQLMVFGAGTAATAQRTTLASDDPAVTLLGSKTDAKSTATDATSISAMSTWKQISASVQALATAIGSTAWDLGVGTSGSRTQRMAIDTSQVPSVGAALSVASIPVAAATDDVMIGSRTETAPASDTASSGLNGRLQRLAQNITTLIGALMNVAGSNIVSGAITSAMTGTTTTSLLAAPGANLRNYLTTLVVSNSHATVGTDIILQDGSGGTTLFTVPAAAVYGGAVVTFNPPLRQPTLNTALFCANVTTGASTKASANGFKAA